MFDEKDMDRTDALGQCFREIGGEMLPPTDLVKAAKAGVRLHRRVGTATHVRRFAGAVVSYAICVILLIGGVYLIPPLFSVQSPFAGSSPVLSFTPENQPEVNHNNYEEGNGENHIDYRDGRFAFLKGSTLTIVDSENRTQKVKGIDAPFQLMNDSVIYIKNEKLIIRSIEEDESITIAENARHFIATDQCIVYEIDDERDVESNLYVYDLATEEPQWIAKDVLKFFIYRQDVLIYDYNNRLCKISLADYSKTDLIEIKPHNWPCTMQMQENLLFIENTNELLVLDLNTNEYRTIEFADRNGGLNYQSLIVSDSYVFASFQYQKSIDYLFTYPADHESNGLWKIDPQTLEKEKICDESFVQLYLFGDHLYGERNGKLYEIDWQNKQIIQIVK